MVRIAGESKCASAPSVVSALPYGSTSERGPPSNPNSGELRPVPGAAIVFGPCHHGWWTNRSDDFRAGGHHRILSVLTCHLRTAIGHLLRLVRRRPGPLRATLGFGLRVVLSFIR